MTRNITMGAGKRTFLCGIYRHYCKAISYGNHLESEDVEANFISLRTSDFVAVEVGSST